MPPTAPFPKERFILNLKQYIRDVPDFPERGIMFRDITPLLLDARAFRHTVNALAERFADVEFDVIVGIDARGLLFAAPLAYELNMPLAIARKKGKLPHATISAGYDLEYGSDTLEIHTDAVCEGCRALIVDDLIATGGTLVATARLVEESGGSVAGIGAVIELAELGARKALAGRRVESLLVY